MENAETTAQLVSRKSHGRSRVGNGAKLLPLTDGRSATARRFKDLVLDISADLGGKDHLSEGQRQLIRRAAMLSAECERQEALAARGEAEFNCDYRPHLAPGECATIVVMAADRAQARSIFRFVIGLLKAVPLIQPMIVDDNTEQITLYNRVIIEIATASFRTTRGYSFAAVDGRVEHLHERALY